MYALHEFPRLLHPRILTPRAYESVHALIVQICGTKWQFFKDVVWQQLWFGNHYHFAGVKGYKGKVFTWSTSKWKI